ncbi:P-loop containing nucleoside triphosphate hydrolase protein [Lentinula guzmanii]|uniref:DNA 3'-5' helicase n=1 Tax=Lentinula guzmanii TaxID=2804957 RepID=A0AA38JQK3_9AGAR|nr:P-loop containing nucleoside triphosphate hydrolase protein [Lentinula guzmanii]
MSNALFRFSSDAGLHLCRQLSEKDLHFVPHDYSLIVATNVLDGVDCLFRSACGSGKTGVLALIALCIGKMGKNPSAIPTAYRSRIPEKPVILVACPTDALEIDLEAKLRSYNVKALAINSDLLADAFKRNEDIWDTAKQAEVLLVSPEMLEGDAFANALKDKSFFHRIYLLVVDEVHLVYQWSKLFRKAYGNIGITRNRLDKKTRLLLLSATVRSGPPYTHILKTFNLTSGNFLDLHRSNRRPEVRVTTTFLPTSPASSYTFPFLSWIIGLRGITIVFTRNRTVLLRIVLYLMRAHPTYAHLIRKCDSTNDLTYDKTTFEMAQRESHEKRLILVSTAVLTVGIDIPSVVRVITLEPLTFEQEIQEGGRVLRRKSKGTTAEVYAYFSKATYDRAKEIVDVDKAGKSHGNIAKTGDKRKLHQRLESADVGMHADQTGKAILSLDMAYRLVADCLTKEQDRQFDNPPFYQDLCTCPMCLSLQPTTSESDTSVTDPPCISSCCMPGQSERDRLLQSRKEVLAPPPDPPKLSRIEIRQRNVERRQQQLNLAGKETRGYLRDRLISLRSKLFDKYGDNYTLYIPICFVPDQAIETILDNFFLLDTPKHLRESLAGQGLEAEWIDDIWLELHDSIPGLLEVHEKHCEDKRRKTKEARDRNKAKKMAQSLGKDVENTQSQDAEGQEDYYDSEVE